MPKLMVDNMDNIQIAGSAGSSFQFSAVRIEDLGSTEYTLVTIAIDRSGSTASFKHELLSSLRAAIEACAKSPRAENLLVRVLEFDDKLEEVHGFLLLKTIDINQYSLTSGGMTALYDATYSGVGATITYAEKLIDQDFNCNGIVFIITDGCDNASKATPAMIKQMKLDAVQQEKIESLLTILVGINVNDRQVSSILGKFNTDASFDQYVEANNASKETLAKLASFVSKSISSQSQSLGTGGPSQVLAF